MDIRDRLLEAAVRVYAELGYRGATTRRIAMEAGVNELTLFRHFGSKAELLHTAVGSCQGPGGGFTLPEVPLDPVAEVGEWVSRWLGELRRHGALIRTALGEVGEHPELTRLSECPMLGASDTLTAYVDRLRTAGLARGEFDARAAAAVLMSSLIVDALVREAMPNVFGADPANDQKEYVRIFLRGIGVEVRQPVGGI